VRRKASRRSGSSKRPPFEVLHARNCKSARFPSQSCQASPRTHWPASGHFDGACRRRDRGLGMDGRTHAALGAGLRSLRPLVAFNDLRIAAGDRASWHSRPFSHESALLGGAGVGHRFIGRHGALSHAGQNGQHHRYLRRMLRLIPHRLDHPERHFPVSNDLRDRPLQGIAAEHDRYNAGLPPATAAYCLFVRGVL
jgi:hypothetical protein